MIFFYFFLGFNESVAACLKQLSPSLLIEFILVFLFLSKQENLHVIYHVLELFYDICSTTHQHKDQITTFHQCFNTNLISGKK